MKTRDIVLDFTSLLDVTLIVIFFFVLFSHLDDQANKALTEEKVKELEEATQQAEMREEEAEELKDRLENEIEIVTESNERQGQNARAIIEYSQGRNFKIFLDMEDGTWKMRIVKDNELVDVIQANERIKDKLVSIFEKYDCNERSTIFCDFFYDGTEPGTKNAYEKISAGLTELRKEYRFLFVSETDRSVGGDER